MSYRFLFIMAILMASFSAQAAISEPENRFYDKSTEHFSATVGLMSMRSGYIRFADAELPPDPNTPVVMSHDVSAQMSHEIAADDTYSLSIDGADSSMFHATITSMSTIENGCTVTITYRPTAMGSHQARLQVTCSKAGSPVTTINLSGEAIAKPGDIDGDGTVGVSDVSTLIDMLLDHE